MAGIIDRQSEKIVVSRKFPDKVVRFTAAHEIGHWQLHPDVVMHRDRPVDGTISFSNGRSQVEREADYFAACFLMPGRLLINEFEKRFVTQGGFVMSDNAAFHLHPCDPESLLRAEKDSLDRELAMARCSSYNGHFFKCLSDLFGVSNMAMAIRLKELKLIPWP